MELIPLSIFAGILTVLSPCVFTLLPVILGSSLKTNSRRKPLIMILSLCIFILLFSIILKASTVLIGIPETFIHILSGLIFIIIGIFTLYPEIWSEISEKLNFQNNSLNFLQRFGVKSDLLSYILSGFALGLLFSSCSPTYALIIATILPRNFFEGMINLLAYTAGLGFILLLISLLGQSIISKMKWAVNPNGTFKKILGIIFIIIGTLVLFGLDKSVESALLQQDWFTNITKFELSNLK